jgi:peptidoglycan/LPS O-acetylase OafA/YrhL
MEASANMPPPPRDAVRASSRIEALDWVKGALVVFMVVYHSIVYSAFLPMAFRFLAFLPPSFIFIAGFVVGQVYASRYNLNSWKPYLRLLARGLKILVLFLILNVGAYILMAHDVVEGALDFFDNAQAIFISGQGRHGVFEILLPIAYFLMLAPVLLWLRSRARASIAVCAAAVFILCFVFERTGVPFKNLLLLSAGLLGMACGLIPIASIDRFARAWPAVVVLYVSYRLCSWRMGETYPVQMFGSVSTLALLYAIALRLNYSKLAARQMVMLGNYSLLGYLAQIPLLRLICHFAHGVPQKWPQVFAVMLIVLALVVLLVNCVDRIRRLNRMADGCYKFVFA